MGWGDTVKGECVLKLLFPSTWSIYNRLRKPVEDPAKNSICPVIYYIQGRKAGAYGNISFRLNFWGVLLLNYFSFFPVLFLLILFIYTLNPPICGTTAGDHGIAARGSGWPPLDLISAPSFIYKQADDIQTRWYVGLQHRNSSSFVIHTSSPHVILINWRLRGLGISVVTQ